jgi:hypothetical protein
MSLTGLVLQFAYRLQRHVRFGQPLARWLGLALLVAAGWSLYRWWPFGWQVVLLVGLFAGYVLVLAWAARSGYVRFRPGPEPHMPTQPAPPLRPEELVPVRASGWFTVEGQDQYFVDVEAGVETMETREHIVMGQIRPTRFLLLGRWPKRDTGWWYMFFRPATIREVGAGRLTFGARSRPALRIVHAPGADTVQTIYLAFDDAVALRRVWEDLVLDAADGPAS